MQLPNANSDLIIIAVVVGVALYAMAVGKAGVRHIILATCAGTVLATQLAANLGNTLSVRLALFAVPIALFAVLLGKHRDKGNRMLNLIAGLAAGLFIMASAVTVMPVADAANFTGGSFLAMELHLFYPVILGAALVLAVLSSLAKQPERSHH